MPHAYRGRHRRHASKRPLTAAAVATAGTALAVGVPALGGVANAATTSDWYRLAQCESSGNWHINTGNGFYGGLQFTQSTWAGYGGTAYAARADLATPTQQIAIANRVLAGQGWNAWPVCSRKVGLYGTSTSGGSTSAPAAAPVQHTVVHHATPKPAVEHSAPAVTHVAVPHTGRSYLVQSGDTLSKIATRFGVAGGWRALWAANQQIISNPNLIFPGQRLSF